MNFPALYKKTGSKWMVWHLWVEEIENKCLIKRRYGQENGKMTETVKEITKGKNIGKSNETTMFQQACNDAQSLFNKQKDTNRYTESKNETTNETVVAPMLAHSFDKHSSKIKYPCYVQPKLDGVRMLCRFPNFQCYSRTGKLFDAVPMRGITDALVRVVHANSLLKDTIVCFDGELYSPDLMFEDIVAACRTSVAHDKDKYTRLEYHIYDFVPKDTKMNFAERYNILKNVHFANEPSLTLVDSEHVDSENDVYAMHERYVSQRYEGIMIRNHKGTYKPSRSYDLQKYKYFVDSEFEITDVKEAEGTDAGTAIIQCKTEKHDLFWVRPKGSREFRKKLLSDKDSIFGKKLTVRYQNLTDKGVPRFPVGICVRDYE